VAYYLIHSMASSTSNFEIQEVETALRFVELIDKTQVKQIIYLGGIVNEVKLSRHLSSRKRVEDILKTAKAPVTVFRAGIIVGSGSASFEIIRDLVEKMPIMPAPKWIETKCQPIGIRNVVQHLSGAILHPEVMGNTYDIGGNDILSYKEMLAQYAEVRGLKRIIFSLPFFSPKISSFWLYFITSTTYKLAANLVNSMKVNVICTPSNIQQILEIEPISYREAVQMAFKNIEQNVVISSWRNALSNTGNSKWNVKNLQVPIFGCYYDQKTVLLRHPIDRVWSNVIAIGGERGWYYGNWLWSLRGVWDKLNGGVGLNRGRTDRYNISTGDVIDVWRVILVDHADMRMLLYAEMKLPGEAWLEFKIRIKDGMPYLHQKATFRPNGISGRLYWNMLLPFHYFIFNGMIRNIEKY